MTEPAPASRFREAFAGFAATLAAAAAPSALAAGYFLLAIPGRPGTAVAVSLVAFLVAFAHAFVLGLPAALALVHLKAFRAVPMALAGALVGMLPAGLIWLPRSGPGRWQGDVLAYLAAAGLGALGALAFYVTHRYMDPAPSAPVHRSGRPSTAHLGAYAVRVADNYHYMDPDEIHLHGHFATWPDAVAAARGIVDRHLAEAYRPGTDADTLYSGYIRFGDDPFIVPVPEGESFSAWEYARERCKALCGGDRPHRDGPPCPPSAG